MLFRSPYLNWEDFKDVVPDNLETTLRHKKLIQYARATHNSNLRRISKNLNIEKMTGHTPRHTLANHMNIQGAPITDIQNVLAHSSVAITQIYVQDRLVNTTTTRAVKTSYDQLNQHRKVSLEL